MIFNVLLLIISTFIYFSFGIIPFLFLTFSTLISFIMGKYLKNNKPLLIIAITLNLSLLFFFKFFINLVNLNKFIIPLGISYYTLQIISYLVDVYQGKYEYEPNLIYYSLFTFYLPHLYIGPISRFNDFKKELVKPKYFSWNNTYLSLQRILWGLIKKTCYCRAY